METKVAELERRLQRAERLVQVLAIGGVFLLAWLVFTAVRPRQPHTSGSMLHLPLRVLDAKGQVRIEAEDLPQANGTILRLFDGGGQPRTILSTADSIGNMHLSWDQGWTALSAYSLSLTYDQPSGGPQSTVSVMALKDGPIAILGRGGKALFHAPPTAPLPAPYRR